MGWKVSRALTWGSERCRIVNAHSPATPTPNPSTSVTMPTPISDPRTQRRRELVPRSPPSRGFGFRAAMRRTLYWATPADRRSAPDGSLESTPRRDENAGDGRIVRGGLPGARAHCRHQRGLERAPRDGLPDVLRRVRPHRGQPPRRQPPSAPPLTPPPPPGS